MEVMEGTSNVCEKRNSRLEVNVLYADTFSMFSSKEKGGRRSREEEITPQCTESNARPRKRTAHGNISRTELPQTQHSLATTVEGPPPSPQTETLRSQRYSQRVSNQIKRNHNAISTSPIPLPQICLNYSYYLPL